MAGCSESGKAADWRRRVGRFDRSGLTVVRFCEKEGVSTASFYRWRNRLADQRAIAESTDERPTGTPGRVGGAPTFQPVRVTRADAPVSIQLPGGVRVEVPAENLDAVRVVLGELLRQAPTSDRGGSSC
jgi:hypothetical protein